MSLRVFSVSSTSAVALAACTVMSTSLLAVISDAQAQDAASSSSRAAPQPSTATTANTAQPPNAAVGTAVEGPQIQEVVVTAQRRTQSLQSVPVAVQVVQGQALQNSNFNSTEDLGQILPAVHIVNTGSYSNSLNVRGIGSGSGNPAFDQSVATFDDDIYQGRSRLIQSTFLDIDRIEVLKGPQTTFFGNNAIAGALNIVTKKPDDHFDGYARALYGSFNTYAVEGAAGGPVNDMLSVRVAGIVNGDTGWIKNVDTGKSSPGEQNQQGRITFAIKPTADFDALLKIEGGYNKLLGATSNTPGQFTNCPPPSPLKASGINMYCPYAIAFGSPIGLHNNENSGLAGQFARLTTNDEVLTLNYHRWGQTFTSVTGYQNYKYEAQEDDAGAGPTVLSTNTTAPETYHQFSEELRVTSPVNQPIEYIVGGYYQVDRLNGLINGNASFTSPALPLYAKLGLLSPATFAAVEQALPIGYQVTYNQSETVGSVFGSLTWNVTDKLKLNGGVRATSDSKHFTGTIGYGQDAETYGGYTPYPLSLQNSLGFFIGNPGTYPYARTDKAVLGSAGLQYQITNRVMSYFTYSHGFKAGGFNAISPSPVGGLVTPSFGPEYVNSYEVGVKSEFFSRRLLVNADLFREDYSGLQLNSLVQLPVNSTIAVTNAASSVSQGVEFESQWAVTSAFRLALNVAYLDAYYSDYPAASPTFLEKQQGIKSQSLSGRPLDFAPKWSGSVSADYRFKLPSDFVLTADLSPFLQSSYFNSNGTDDPNFLIKGNVRLDGRLTLDSPSRRWAVDLIGKNLTNADIPVTFGTNDVRGGKEEPFNVAIQGRYRW